MTFTIVTDLPALVLNVTEATDAPDSTSLNTSQKILIAFVGGIFSLLTVIGNIMVMVSFKIDKQLQTISNYFLFSLAVADFVIGAISLPLFTMFTIVGYWPLGPYICDTWLALDYLASNASVLNLLIISFDRYFSVTRPLTYRAKRTTTRAAVMIGCAWGISLLLWPPWIYAWPYIEGQRMVPPDQCYIQFIETNHYITFGTAIAAFYVPALVMSILYWRIWRETKKRAKDLPNLQAGKKHDSSKRSNSSDEATAVNNHALRDADGDSVYHVRGALPSQYRWRDSAPVPDKFLYSQRNARKFHWLHKYCAMDAATLTIRCTGVISQPYERGWRGWCGRVRAWCYTWWHSGRDDLDDTEPEEEASEGGLATPVSVETPLQSSVSRCTSLNVIRDPYVRTGVVGTVVSDVSPRRYDTAGVVGPGGARDSRSLPPNARLAPAAAPPSASHDAVYTILIRLPSESGDSIERAPSIKMIHDDVPLQRAIAGRHNDFSLDPVPHNHLARRASHLPDVRIPLNAKIIPKQLAGKPMTKQQEKKKKKTQEKKQESKAAKTLSAILLSFIVTWTPYNILVLLKPLTACEGYIPDFLWSFFYALCYINSTINPMCYALCNASFRRTYVRILTCKWKNRNREGISRGVYN